MKPNTKVELKASPERHNSLREGQRLQPSSTSTAWHVPRALLAIGMVLCGASISSAQSLSPWSTVDDVENGWQWAMAADRSGHVYVAGDVTVAGVLHACITRSADQGENWTNMVHSDVNSYSAIAAETIEVVPATESNPALVQNYLVVAGTANGQWITRRSLDAGETWATLDIFKHTTWNSSSKPDITGVGIDSAGNMYVVGFATKTTVVKNKASSAYYWLVRRIAKDATAESETGKTTVDLFDTAKGGYSWPSGVVCVGANVFISGTSGDRWQVRKSSDGGAQWNLVDDFRYNSSYASQANAITADESGNVFVVGTGRRAVGRSTPGYWIVRKGTGAGTASFQTVDRFEFEPSKHSAAYGVSVDGSGNVHVTGQCFAAVGAYQPGHWITRRFAATTGLWSTTDHYFLSPGSASMGLSIVADSADTVFAAGVAADGSGWQEWVVRRQVAP